jgi:hypothetical protein
MGLPEQFDQFDAMPEVIFDRIGAESEVGDELDHPFDPAYEQKDFTVQHEHRGCLARIDGAAKGVKGADQFLESFGDPDIARPELWPALLEKLVERSRDPGAVARTDNRIPRNRCTLFAQIIE